MSNMPYKVLTSTAAVTKSQIMMTATNELTKEEVDIDKNSLITYFDEALSSNQTSAQLIVDQINTFRQQDKREITEMILNDLLNYASSNTPWWTGFRLTSKFSKRGRRASLLRIIELSTLKLDQNGPDSKNVLSNEGRKRQSLYLILQNLADANSISQLEKIAKRESKQQMTPQDILQRIPDDLETPKYKLLNPSKSSFYEIRQYEPFATCTVQMKTESDSPAGSAFGTLASYLFGKNKSSTKMKMTTPVFSTSDSTTKVMSFVLPSDYWNAIDSAPQPLDTNSGLQLIAQSKQVRAVLLFGGFATQKDVDKKKKELLDYINNDTEWNVLNDNDFLLAQYNDPFTPPWKRRNEVSILVTSS